MSGDLQTFTEPIEANIEAAQSSVITDPAGDMLKNNAEPWQDIVWAQVTREGNTFTFSMRMVGELPTDPPEAPGSLGWYFWDWGINTDPALAPAGWPWPKSHATPHEFIVGFGSDGEEYFALVADRRPLVLGGEPIITRVPFRVDGALMQVFVDADLLDNPTEFGWRVGSHSMNAHLETEGHHHFDTAPNEPVWVDWPPDDLLQ